MSTVTFAAIKSKVEELCTQPSTCPELKAVCMEWLAAVGTDRQQEMNTKLIKEVGEDINTLEETAAQLAKKAHDLKAEGKKYCFCPSCTICLFILENKEVLL